MEASQVLLNHSKNAVFLHLINILVIQWTFYSFIKYFIQLKKKLALTPLLYILNDDQERHDSALNRSLVKLVMRTQPRNRKTVQSEGNPSSTK